MSKRKTMLNKLETIRKGKEGPGYPVSPKLLDERALNKWQLNLLANGSPDAIRRYQTAMTSRLIKMRLGLTSHHGT